MLHLRAIVPADRTDRACAVLADHPGVTNLVVLPGAARAPRGDLVTADVAREAANEVLRDLCALDLERDGSLALEEIDLSLSDAAERAEARAPGAGDDAVVWAQLDRETAAGAELTWSFVTFLVLATLLAGIAAIIDSSILVVGAMVVGPEFSAVAAVCFGIAAGRPRRVGAALRTLAVGFAAAIAIAYVCTLLGRWTGLIELSELPAERPQTAFIYSPDRWSFIVALLAGAAGVLSMTSGKSATLVGVFISVTTVPAAGNLAVALGLKHRSQIDGSLLQLGVNLAGMVIAGVLTLLVQRAVWWAVLRRTGRLPAGPRPAVPTPGRDAHRP
ncbi:DUF389 domain-containing protein [Actinomadura parmotrematis]|uniref:DUF389 domain-containing protein n=1 Tax=Actinomadura parmotrematis TaxID=2864039 RepID=A0ABS7G3Z6_9ACTN|nr:DUF389 domain-containing protein [Actinomadura parmotrematis]MBW8487446.1 DUF389 domain-containing protein [Actinomadura parmotrematis]